PPRPCAAPPAAPARRGPDAARDRAVPAGAHPRHPQPQPPGSPPRTPAPPPACRLRAARGTNKHATVPPPAPRSTRLALVADAPTTSEAFEPLWGTQPFIWAHGFSLRLGLFCVLRLWGLRR